MRYLKIFVFILFICIESTAFSWDGTGHRIISTIAYNHLTPETKQKIDALTLQADPDYPPLTRFLYLSTLPDQWRQADQNLSGNWHFINLAWSADGTPTYPAITPNLISILQKSLTILTNAHNTPAEKTKALAYVIHLTEDAHQPLHCINRFNKTFPQGDKGGNLFTIHAKYVDNLHAYWDQSARLMQPDAKSYPLTNKQVLKLAEKIQTDYPKNKLGFSVNNLSATDWTAESYQIAQQKVYDITWGSKPSAAYKAMQREVAAQQIALAGYRLANLLNRLM